MLRLKRPKEALAQRGKFLIRLNVRAPDNLDQGAQFLANIIMIITIRAEDWKRAPLQDDDKALGWDDTRETLRVIGSEAWSSSGFHQNQSLTSCQRRTLDLVVAAVTMGRMLSVGSLFQTGHMLLHRAASG